MKKLTPLTTISKALTLFILLGVFPKSSFASNKRARGDLNFDYALNASFIYYDRFDPMDAISQIYGNDQMQPLDRKWTRRPGLEHLSLDLSWRYFTRSSLELRLRPDAAMDRFDPFLSKAREIDTRAGSSYRKRPTISLLDLYALNIKTSDNFSVSLGVFDRLEPDRSTFESLLDFGLEVQMPRKFSALKLSLVASPLPTASLNTAQLPRHIITAFIFEGRDDRNERLAPQNQPTDYGPSAMDPYFGTAISLDSIQNDKWQFNAMVGNLDSQSSVGNINETFASISAIWRGKTLGLDSRISYWGKWAKERWNSQEISLPEIEQLSHGLSGVHKFNETQEMFWGMQYAMSERVEDEVENSIVSYRGEKLDIGYKTSLPGHVSITAMLSTERRQQKKGDVSVGAFSFDDQNNRSRLTRLGLRMSYDIH